MRSGMLRGMVGYLLGLVLASVLLGALVAHDRPELEQALAERSTCQVLVVGPSYINTGFVEGRFDEEAQRLGLGLKSCKYAEAGLTGYEVRHALELLLRERWPKLEYVLIDITLGDRVRFPAGNWYKPRVVDWHTLPVLAWVHKRYERLPKAERPPAYTLAIHAAHVLLNYLGVGRGITALRNIRLPAWTEGEGDAPKRRRSARKSQPPGYDARLRRVTADKARV